MDHNNPLKWLNYWTQFVCWSLERIPTVCTDFWTHIRTERQVGKDQRLHLGRLNETEIEAFEALQHRLLLLTIMALPRLNGHYTLETDAYDKKVRCILLWEQPEGLAKPVGYRSRSLNKANRYIAQRVSSASLSYWPSYSWGRISNRSLFTIRTDHEVLCWILNERRDRKSGDMVPMLTKVRGCPLGSHQTWGSRIVVPPSYDRNGLV